MIKMYGTSWCGDCRAARAFLKANNIEYTEINIDEDESAAKLVVSVNNGKRSVPTFDIDGKFVNCSPFNEQKLRDALGV